jgi:hypothetical protein
MATSALSTLSGLAWNTNHKCFHFGFGDSQGRGWDEVSGDDWVWPESQAAVLSVVGDAGQYDLVVIDEKSGLPYLITGRETPSGSNTGIVWKDKVDPNISGSGSDIETALTLREHYGEKLGYDIWHEQSRIHPRPVKNENRGATGFDSNGLPTGLQFTSTFYANGEIVAKGTMSNIPTDSEYVHDRRFKGNTLQQEISTNKSNFKVIRTESIYKVSDVQKIPSMGGNTESAYELELSAPIVWLSRGETLLKNRSTNITLSGTVSATDGADGLSTSGMNVTTVSLANVPIAAGTVMLLSKTAYAISGLSLDTHSTITVNGTTWYFRYVTGSIPGSLTLGVGTVFDLRIYNTVISSAALAHYIDNIDNFEGRSYLPTSG